MQLLTRPPVATRKHDEDADTSACQYTEWVRREEQGMQKLIMHSDMAVAEAEEELVVLILVKMLLLCGRSIVPVWCDSAGGALFRSRHAHTSVLPVGIGLRATGPEEQQELQYILHTAGGCLTAGATHSRTHTPTTGCCSTTLHHFIQSLLSS
jgi:hypothetical protein